MAVPSSELFSESSMGAEVSERSITPPTAIVFMIQQPALLECSFPETSSLRASSVFD